MTDKIVSTQEDGVAHILFNNPERRNAVSLEMWQAVGRALDGFAADERVRVVVLSGAGDKAFVSGADISKFEQERASAEAIKHYNKTTAEASDKLLNFAKPTIAQITGSCVGGGVALAACCDLRICGESSRFGIPAAKLGLGYGMNRATPLVDLIGPAYAKEMFFTGRQFTAQEAEKMGLVNRVVPDDKLESTVEELARTIAENAPLTVKCAKLVVGEVLKDADKRDIAATERAVEACFKSADYKEGQAAFMEKRKPKFIGA